MSLQGNNLPVYATVPQNNGGSITNSTGSGVLGTDTNGVAIYTAGANGSRVYGLFLATTDTVADNIFLYIKVGTSIILPIGQINVPAGAGNIANTACVDGISSVNCPGLPFDGTGKPYIELAANAVLKISANGAISTGKTLFASTIGSDY